MIGLLHPAFFRQLTGENSPLPIRLSSEPPAETLIPIDQGRILNNEPTNYEVERLQLLRDMMHFLKQEIMLCMEFESKFVTIGMPARHGVAV
jgi:hypothetical protein